MFVCLGTHVVCTITICRNCCRCCNGGIEANLRVHDVQLFYAGHWSGMHSMLKIAFILNDRNVSCRSRCASVRLMFLPRCVTVPPNWLGQQLRNLTHFESHPVSNSCAGLNIQWWYADSIYVCMAPDSMRSKILGMLDTMCYIMRLHIPNKMPSRLSFPAPWVRMKLSYARLSLPCASRSSTPPPKQTTCLRDWSAPRLFSGGPTVPLQASVPSTRSALPRGMGRCPDSKWSRRGTRRIARDCWRVLLCECGKCVCVCVFSCGFFGWRQLIELTFCNWFPL